MTKVEFNLPDELAERAAAAGLLSSEQIQAWLLLQLKGEGMARLRGVMARASDGEAGMSAEDVAAEIRLLRADRRSNAQA